MNRLLPNRLLAGAALIALLAAPALAGKPAGDPLSRAFEQPAPSARPYMRWWWPGDAVSDAELRREVALMDASGFGGAEIQAFNPGIPGLTPAERGPANGYAQPAFFAHVKTAARAALDHDFRLDFTFGSGWPSGGGKAITPERALLELSMAVTPVEGGAGVPVRVTIPARTTRLGAFPPFDPQAGTPEGQDWRRRHDARARTVAVMAFRGDAPTLRETPKQGLQLTPWSDVIRTGALDPASRIDLTSRFAPDGTLDWTPPPGHWLVFVFRQYASNTSVLGASGTGPQLVLDHFDRRAFAAHAARVGDPLAAALGPDKAGIRAGFVDSLELFQDLPWTESFLAEFKARRGYDLEPWLPFVVEPGWMQTWGAHYSPPYFDARGDASLADRVRADYRQTVSDLLTENFVEPFVAWNHAHGFFAKFQAHGAPLDTIRGYGLADIPETEDLEGADPLFMRLARSAADIYGKKLVSAESMVWKDRPYSVTPDELRRRADLLFAGGVNAETVHGYSYALHVDKWPGWFAFQPSAFATGFSTMLDERNPIWAGVPRLAAYMTRMNAVMRQGQGVAPVALFYGNIGYFEGIDGNGPAASDREKSLIAGGYDYDRINADGLSRSRVEGRRLVTPGGHRFAALVLPDIGSLHAETAEAVARFARQGLPVLFTASVPARETGLFDHEARDKRVAAAMAEALGAGGRQVAEADLVVSLHSAGVAANLRFTGDARDIVFVERRVGRQLVYFLYNHGDSRRDAGFVTPVAGAVERWDAMNGTRAPMAATRMDGGMRVALSLEPGGSVLLVVDPGKPSRAVLAPREVASLALPEGGWQLGVDGHVRGGAVLARDMGAVSLGDWRAMADLSGFSGVGTYRRGFTLPAGWLGRGRQVRLTLHGVHDMATVTVNGRRLAPLICAPWAVDITSAVKPGANRLAIAIANVPQNAMIDAKALGFRNLQPVAAGLEGPVTLELTERR